MNAISVGSVYATFELRLQKLEQQESAAIASLKGMAASVESIAETMNKKLAADAAKSAAAVTAAQERALQKQAAATAVAAEKQAAAVAAAEAKQTAIVEAAAKKRVEAIKDLAEKGSKAALMLGGAMAAGLGVATKQAADFDQAMRNVNSIAHESEQQFQRTSASVLSLTKDPNIRQGPSDLAKGMYDVVSSGFQGQKALDILRTSALGASAGMTDTATSSRALMAVLNSGVKGVSSVSQAMDVLFQEVNLGVNTFPQLANSLGKVLPTAKQAGVSIQEIAAAYATMTREGISLEEAETALNNLLTHIIKPGKDSAEVMKALGIEHGIATLQAKGLTGVLEQITTHTHGNAQALVELMPELRAMKGLLVLADEGGQKYTEMLAGMTDATKVNGATQRAAEEQMKGTTAQYEKMKQQAEVLGVEIGTKLLPAVNRLLGKVRDLASGFGDLKPEMQDFIFKAGVIGTVSVLASGGLGKIALGAIALNKELKAVNLTLIGVLGRVGTLAALAGGAVAFGKMVKEGFESRFGPNSFSERTTTAMGMMGTPGSQGFANLGKSAPVAPAGAEWDITSLAERATAHGGMWADILSSANMRGLGLPALHKDKDAEKAAKKAAKDAKEAAREAKETARELADAQTEILRLGGDNQNASIAEAIKEFYEGKDKKIPLDVLNQRLRLKVEKAVADHKQQMKEAGKKFLAGMKESFSGVVAASAYISQESAREADYATAERVRNARLGLQNWYDAGRESARKRGERFMEGFRSAFFNAGLRTGPAIAEQIAERERRGEEFTRGMRSIFGGASDATAREFGRRSAATEAIERTRNQMRRSLGGMLGQEVAFSFADGFAKAMEKAFGHSDIGKIFARGLSRWIDREIDNLTNSLFDSIGKVLTRKGKEAGQSSSLSIAGGGNLPGMGMPPIGGDPRMQALTMGLNAAMLATAKHAQNAAIGSALGSGIALAIPGGAVFAPLAGAVGGFLGGLFADGGDPPVGKWSLVGERGPELIMPKSPMTVVPNHALAGAAGGGAPQVTVHLSGDHHYHNEMDARAVARQVAREIEFAHPVRARRA